MLNGGIVDGTILKSNDCFGGPVFSELNVDEQPHVIGLLFPAPMLDDDQAIEDTRQMINAARMTNLEIPIILFLTRVEEVFSQFIQFPMSPQELLSSPEVNHLIRQACTHFGIPPRDIRIQMNYHEQRTIMPAINFLTLSNLKLMLDTATDYIINPIFERRVLTQQSREKQVYASPSLKSCVESRQTPLPTASRIPMVPEVL